jgi:iron complex transport system substrate-binding protein
LAGPRVLSLDQCADQYVLELVPRADIVGLSTRADDADSRLRSLARGLPQRRTDLESALVARPDIVVRYWGGDPKLLAALSRRGARVVTIGEANDLPAVRRNIAQVSSALGQPARGAAVTARFDARLAGAAGAWKGREASYLTPGSFTAGGGTLVDSILRGAGLRNAEQGQGYRLISLERMALDPPKALVLGFFDTFQLSGAFWGEGRHAVLKKAARNGAVASLPGALLSCPDGGAGEAVALLGRAAP